MNSKSKIYLAGSTGLVGSAVLKELIKQNYTNIYHPRIDLTNSKETEQFFKEVTPEYVFLCAAKVGGILANRNNPVEFLETNLAIQNNTIKYAHMYGVKKLLFLGSSCIFPGNINRPIVESDLLSGPLEQTNSAYAIAKIAGIELLKAYKHQYGFNSVCLMPPNMYGIGDNFDSVNAHVLPALLRKFHFAKKNNQPEVICWGTGTPRREFLFSEDLAKACIHFMNLDINEVINTGYGEDISIKDLANLIADIVGYKGNIIWDTSKPDGTMRKLLDSSKANYLRWKAETSLTDGIKKTYEWYCSELKD